MYGLYHCQKQRQQMGLVPHKCWDSQVPRVPRLGRSGAFVPGTLRLCRRRHRGPSLCGRGLRTCHGECVNNVGEWLKREKWPFHHETMCFYRVLRWFFFVFLTVHHGLSSGNLTVCWWKIIIFTSEIGVLFCIRMIVVYVIHEGCDHQP